MAIAAKNVYTFDAPNDSSTSTCARTVFAAETVSTAGGASTAVAAAFAAAASAAVRAQRRIPGHAPSKRVRPGMHCHTHGGPISVHAHVGGRVGAADGRVSSGNPSHDAHVAPLLCWTRYCVWLQCGKRAVGATAAVWLDSALRVDLDAQPSAQTWSAGSVFEQFRQS